MKKAFSISIAQTLFMIEEDAYQKLDIYLKSVRSHFAKTIGGQEIVQDIESRIAELFLASKKQIITMMEVDSVIESMGRVEDFAQTGTMDTQTNQRDAEETVRTGQKRLFRDTDNGIVAGVSAGLSAYVGIDPLWIRLLFILLTITSGVGIIIYIILWIAMPEAKTTAQKLEMQGSPVTIENLTENLTEKMSSVAKHPEHIIRRFTEGVVAVIGSIVRGITSLIGPIARWVVGLGLGFGSLFGMVMLSIGLAVFLSGSYREYVDFPLQHVLSQAALFFGAIGAYLCLFIPALFIFLFAVGLLRKKHVMNPAVGFCLFGVWCVALVGAVTAGIHTGGRYQTYINESPEYKETTQSFAVSTSTKTILLSGGEQVRFVQGSDAGVEVVGRAYDLKHVVVENENDTLTIKRAETAKSCFLCGFKRVEVVITLPTLEALEVRGGVDFTTEAWKSTTPVSLKFFSGTEGDIAWLEAPTVAMALEHGSSVQVVVSTTESMVNASNGSVVELAGKSTTSTLVSEYGSEIRAQKTEMKSVTASAMHGANIRVGDVETLHAEAESGGDIEYTGDPILTTKGDETGRLRKRENKLDMDMPESLDVP